MRNGARIALLTQGYFSAGGVQAVSRWLRAGLEAQGYVVDVHELATAARDENSRLFTQPRSWFRRTIRQPAGREEVTCWGANGAELEPLRYLPRRELSRELASYDLVQIVAGGGALALAAAKSQRPVVLQVATRVQWERAVRDRSSKGLAGAFRRGMTGFVAGFEPRAIRSAHHVLVENEAMRDYVRSVGQTHVTVAPPGVDTDVFVPNLDGWRRDGYILSVCRLSDPRKGLDRMVMAYAALRDRVTDCPRLVMAGRGDLDAETYALVDSLGLRQWVDVRRDVPVSELPGLYRGASVFWQTSYEEGLGISSIEAQASGLPVVATRTEGSAQAVRNGVSGYLVPGDHLQTLTTQMVDRTTKILRSDGQISADARSWAVAEFSDRAALAPYLATYERALSGE